MGVFKKFIAELSIESLGTLMEYKPNTSYTVLPYKDLNGNSRSTTNQNGSLDTYSFGTWNPYGVSIPVATADLLEDYDINDYQITEVGTTTYTTTRVLNATNATLTYSISINNTTEDPITVKCIKFKKQIFYSTNSSKCWILSHAYYLDESEWVTIPAGETGAVTIVMRIGL